MKAKAERTNFPMTTILTVVSLGSDSGFTLQQFWKDARSVKYVLLNDDIHNPQLECFEIQANNLNMFRPPLDHEV